MASQNNFDDVYEPESTNRFDQPNLNDTYSNQQTMLNNNGITTDQNHHPSSIYHQPIINPYGSEQTRNYQQSTSENISPQQLFPDVQNPLQYNNFSISSQRTFVFNLSTINPDTLQQICTALNNNTPPSTNNSSQSQQ
ncbi:20789_t:CDS:2 [Rhizophagus irregularis]|nr:20789_t:CDS:2 [Rhizophagus irregularis]